MFPLLRGAGTGCGTRAVRPMRGAARLMKTEAISEEYKQSFFFCLFCLLTDSM